jgi:hypothetical protein
VLARISPFRENEATAYKEIETVVGHRSGKETYL